MTGPWPDDCGNGGEDYVFSSSSHNYFTLPFNILASICNSELEHFLILFISMDDIDLFDLLSETLALILGLGALTVNGVMAKLVVEVWVENKGI